MKNDLDSLMQSKNIDAILITGPGQHNPAMVYQTRGAHLTNADLIKLRGQTPVLFHASMERDEAARSGLPTKDLSNYPISELLVLAGGDALKAYVRRYQRMFADLGLTSGRVLLYGQIDAGQALAIFSALQEAMPGIKFVSESGNTLMLQARATKDDGEIERIRRMGQITTAVVGQVADFLTSHKVKDEILVKPDGNPLTIGDIKQRINLWLAERGADNPEGTIFAIGYDAAVPHSTGAPGDLLSLGQTIIFDIFPCEPGGGYFYDFTRTWCLGYAPDEVQALYADVLLVHNTILSELSLGAPTRQYHIHACQLFEERGHPTARQNPQTQDGFVHGLGHGLGLNVHENPRLSLFSPEGECLESGAVFTVEPGLYYPKRKMGVRIEDTIWMRPDGMAEVLSPYPYDLVLPISK